MSITRRRFVQSAALAGPALLVSTRWASLPAGAVAPPLKKFRDSLTWPAFVDGRDPVHLSLVNGTHRFHGSLGEARTLTYRLTRGSILAAGPRALDGYLGPTIVAVAGQGTTVTATNAIDEHPLAGSLDPAVHGTLRTDAGQPRTAVHLHGGNSSVENDGGPLDTFPRGSVGRPGFPNPSTYTYPNSQDAAQLWYHDHALGITRLNVYAGMAGGYLIRDTPASGIDTGDGTHLPAPPYELPLVIQDRTFDASGGLAYDASPWVPEFFGDAAVVNGTAYPYLDVARGVYRFRLYNGSNARFYRLKLSVKATGAALGFWQIGSDGGLLNAAVPLTRLLIAPGERADLLVDFREFSAGDIVDLTNNAVAPFPTGARSHRKGGVPLAQIMQFRVRAARGWAPPLPIGSMNLRPVTPVVRLDSAARSAPVRTHSLVEILAASGEVLLATLNNRTFDRRDFAGYPIARNSLEVWEFANTTMDSHPIHLHLVQFQVLNRQAFDATGYLGHYDTDGDGLVVPNSGPYPAPSPAPFLTGRVLPPDSGEVGWKDTVQVPPGMVTRIAVPFGTIGAAPVAARDVYAGDYVWHCHILEHEDHDMMQRYRIH